jgi:uncharacterized protein (DUF58 family)
VAEVAASVDASEVAKRAALDPAKPFASERPWKRHLRSTREGKAFIMVTIGVGLAAFNTGNNLLFLILGFMLSLIVLSGVMSETAIRGLRVSRRLPQRAFAGKVCLVELVLHNKKPRAPSYSLEIEDLAQDAPTERRCYFLKVGPGAEQAAAYRRTLNRRGSLRFVGFRVATRYPFGIFEKWRMLTNPAELLVYPKLLADQDLRHDMKSHGLDSPTQRIGVGTEIAGLRSYETGDDARSIHWPRTASLGRLVVTERQSDASSQLTLLLDNARSINTPEEDEQFERMVSRAATLAVAGLSHGLSVEVIARGSRSPLLVGFTAADPILRYLALIESVNPERAPHFGAYARNTRVIFVGASDSPVIPSREPT